MKHLYEKIMKQNIAKLKDSNLAREVRESENK